MHKARNVIRDKYHKSNQFPGCHSLPTFVPNPAVELPTWKGLLSEYRTPSKYFIPFSVVAILAIIGVPLSVSLEFPDKFLLYAKLYPHIILYLFIAFWGALWMTYKAFCQIINKTELKIYILAALMISTFLLFGVELSYLLDDNFYSSDIRCFVDMDGKSKV
ncbi:MAG: hypothetical protein N5P05_001420 [Chroococcopsis gigantea SAG 12.99]|nr:hypothetical protein [Chlorogloea purpurea SAG 13.99]MDV2999814.1 hypothetical protein [Chroococcopsis gigantea SAG 12.99]